MILGDLLLIGPIEHDQNPRTAPVEKAAIL